MRLCLVVHELIDQIELLFRILHSLQSIGMKLKMELRLLEAIIR